LTGRDFHPLGSTSEFQGDITFSSPFRPSFAWRTGKSAQKPGATYMNAYFLMPGLCLGMSWGDGSITPEGPRSQGEPENEIVNF